MMIFRKGKENKMKVIAVLDKNIPKGKMTEAMAIQRAVISGACNKCQHLKQCEKDETFKFPKDAECMKIMRILNNSKN